MEKSRSVQIITGTVILLILLAAVWVFLLPAMDPWATSLYARFTPKRPASDQIVLVTLDDQDIQSLGGWPISRDYYAYMIHALSESGARTIGMDFLFSETDSLFHEYDQALAGFIRSSGNVVLPSIIQSDGEHLEPAPLFREHAVIGFSNLGDETGDQHTTPMTIFHNHHMVYSFGFELARHYLNISDLTIECVDPLLENVEIILIKPDSSTIAIPLDHWGQFVPHYFGGLDRVKTIGFVELLQTFQSAPDSLDLKDKLVLVAPIAETLPIVKQIPKYGTVPGSLIHLTVAENIITGKIIRSMPQWLMRIIGFIISILLIWVIGTKRHIFGITLLLSFSLIWIILSFILYRIALIIMPSDPCLFILFGALCLTGLAIFSKYSKQKSRNILLENEIEQTRNELKQTRSEKQTADEEKDEAILRLEKHLRDLEAIRLPDRITKEFGDIIHAQDSPMREVLRQVQTVARDTIPVLISGETGTGKELIARAIHQSSLRNDKAFMAINCGALSENLLESELFGHEKGSFTGAHARRIGRFEQAHQGTLFLDEISETSSAFQARLLRVLQEGAFERVGGQQLIQTDVRIIAATNRDLKADVDKGQFRPDLFFRLNGFPITLPPLRDRKVDIPLLVRYFLDRHGQSQILSLSQAAMDRLQNYDWPGNVRELENCIRRAAILASSRGQDQITAEDLSQELESKTKSDATSVTYQPMEELILTSLRNFKFSRSAITQTARVLGDKDRGTITEYFRGLCFQALVDKDYRIDEAVQEIAGTDERKIIAKVDKKLRSYLDNVISISPDELGKAALPSTFHGLPKQFHSFLKRIIQNKDRIE